MRKLSRFQHDIVDSSTWQQKLISLREGAYSAHGNSRNMESESSGCCMDGAQFVQRSAQESRPDYRDRVHPMTYMLLSRCEIAVSHNMRYRLDCGHPPHFHAQQRHSIGIVLHQKRISNGSPPDFAPSFKGSYMAPFYGPLP